MRVIKKYCNDKSLTIEGFSLPVVIVSSVVMMMILLSAISSTVSVRTAVQAQYYESLARTAAESGIEYAKACLGGDHSVSWSEDKPLTPETDCNGDQVDGQSEFVLITPKISTTFRVGEPIVSGDGKVVSISSSGTSSLLRTSTGTPWRTYHYNTAELISD